MTNMTMGDAEYRALLSRWSSLKRTFFPTTHALRADLAEMNAQLTAAELAGSVCRIADVVDDYEAAVAMGDMSGAEL